VVAQALGSDGEPAEHGGRQHGSTWRSGIGGVEEKLRGGSILPGDGALMGYGRP
jgi:hypothetical protein